MLEKIRKLQNKFLNIAKTLKSIILKHKKKSVAIAALVTLLGFAPLSLYIFTFLSFIVLAIVLNNTAKFKERIWAFFIFICVFNVVNLHLVGNSFLYNAPEPWLVYAMPLAILILGLLLAVPYLLTFLIIDGICSKINRFYIRDLLVIPLVFIISENLRSLTVFGFPWNIVGYSIATNDTLLQICDLFNITLCSFMIIFVGMLFAKLNKNFAIAGLGMLFLWSALGAVRVNQSLKTRAYSDILTKTKIIQMDSIEHHRFNRNKMREQSYFYIEGLKAQQAKSDEDRPELIIFPEMAIPYSVQETPNLLNVLRSNMNDKEVLVLGSPGYEDMNIYNSLFYITKNDLVRYDKKLRVPFGEFMPFRSILDKVKNFTNNYKDFSVGTKENLVQINGNKFLSLICYEVIFPQFVKAELNGAKDVTLLNLTNDAWFYGTVAPAQHALIAKTRAVENNLPIIRAANAGTSYISY